MLTVRRTQTALSVRQRLEIIERLKNGETSEQLANEYNIHPDSVRRIKRNSHRLHQYCKNNKSEKMTRMRRGVHDELETKLYTWFVEQKALGNSLTGTMIQEKALEINMDINGLNKPKFKASSGWLEGFKRRHGIDLPISNGSALTSIGNSARLVSSIAHLINEHEIELQNIYSMSETCLAWRSLPQKILAQIDDKTLIIDDTIKRHKVTLGLCANATGSHMLQPLFIHNENPEVLKIYENGLLPVVYMSDSNASVTQNIFNSWYERHFKPSVRKHQVDNNILGKVLLLVKNCMEHRLYNNFPKDNNFMVMYFPPETLNAQPMINQGVTAKVKQSFHLKVLQQVLNWPGGISQFYAAYNIKDCIHLAYDAWNNVTSPTIQNTWFELLKNIPGMADNASRSDTPQDTNSMQKLVASGITSQGLEEWLQECAELEQIHERKQYEEQSEPILLVPEEQQKEDEWVLGDTQFGHIIPKEEQNTDEGTDQCMQLEDPSIKIESEEKWVENCTQFDVGTETEEKKSTVNNQLLDAINVDQMFCQLSHWSEGQPLFVKHHVKKLLEYYSQNH